LQSPYAAPQAARYVAQQGQDSVPLLTALMDRETDLRALGMYCDSTTGNEDRRFAASIRRSLTLLAAEPAAMTDGPAGGELASAIASILNAAAVYKLADQVPTVQKLMESREPTIRVAAQSAAARLGLPKAIEHLHAQLGRADLDIRRQAADTLMKVPPANETERAARERAALSHLGAPAEDCAMRVLATCGREATVAALRPILDGPNVPRAVYAASPSLPCSTIRYTRWGAASTSRSRRDCPSTRLRSG
jgi:HEAT repeat protein